MKHLRNIARRNQGFSLVEIAVVLVIIAILATAIGVPLASQLDQQKTKDTEKQLELIKEAIYGFAMANGRLPCPASAASAGRESFCSADSPAACGTELVVYSANGRCFTADGFTADGFTPSATLGLAPVDSGGFMQDGWADGTAARRLRYAVSTNTVGVVTNVLTQNDGIKSATMASVAGAPSFFFYICAPGLATVPTVNCGTAQELTKLAPFVVYSLSKDASNTSPDSANNQNGDRVFTSGTPTATFDDIVTWGSLNTLFARMVQAGKLP
jgi:prepilin-type N-terminal cleavage/methylation domain-containing protein